MIRAIRYNNFTKLFSYWTEEDSFEDLELEVFEFVKNYKLKSDKVKKEQGEVLESSCRSGIKSSRKERRFDFLKRYQGLYKDLLKVHKSTLPDIDSYLD